MCGWNRETKRECKRREDVENDEVKIQCDRRNDKIRIDEQERDKCEEKENGIK